MAKIGWDNGVLILPETTTPATTAGVGKIYATTSQSVNLLDSTGADTDLVVSDPSILNGRTQFNSFTPIEITKDA